jgi:hypothetical protein
LGGVYLRGLMLDGKRKSIEPMAARLEDGDEQCLQQFVTAAGMLEAEGRFRKIIGYPDLAKLAAAVARDVAARRAADTPATTLHTPIAAAAPEVAATPA